MLEKSNVITLTSTTVKSIMQEAIEGGDIFVGQQDVGLEVQQTKATRSPSPKPVPRVPRDERRGGTLQPSEEPGQQETATWGESKKAVGLMSSRRP